MFFRLQNRLHRWQLDRVLRKVVDTPRVRLDPRASFVVVSLTREIDIFMYLLALKSFCSWSRPRGVCLLTDGEFTPAATALLNAQVPGIVLTPHVEFRDPRCPQGGCWERILALSGQASESYVIQLDADTVTLGMPATIRDCIAAGRPFTLGSGQGQALEPADDAATRACEWLSAGDAHVQTLAESVLGRLAAPNGVRYVRGCAALVGIPRGAVSTDHVATQAAEFSQLVGPRWTEWGTEQFMSNFLLANLADCVVLPHPQYATCGGIDERKTLVAHMAGFCRFADGRYARLAERALAAANGVR
jgi:hypothetical protein